MLVWVGASGGSKGLVAQHPVVVRGCVVNASLTSQWIPSAPFNSHVFKAEGLPARPGFSLSAEENARWEKEGYRLAWARVGKDGGVPIPSASANPYTHWVGGGQLAEFI